MTEVERTSKRKRRLPWGRWADARSSRSAFAEEVGEEVGSPVEFPVAWEPGVPATVEVDAQALMHPSPQLPVEPKMVQWQGEHLFIVLVAYQVDALEMAQAAGRPQLQARQALDVSPPSCYWCGQPWGLRTFRSKCRGEQQI